MRAKTEWVQEKDTSGKTTIRKVGMAPIQRDGLEYEFDVMFDHDQDSHRAMCTKTRYPQAFPDSFNERLHFDHVEKLAPLLTSDPVAAARVADEEGAVRAEQERQAREREAKAKAEAAAARRPPPAPATVTTPPPQAPATDPLTPGVDVPAMAATPAPAAAAQPAAAAPPPAADTSGWTPADHVADKIAKAKTATELLRVMPDIRKLADADDKEMMTAVYQEKKAALIKAAQAGGQQ
jgi:hypothetical protein